MKTEPHLSFDVGIEMMRLHTWALFSVLLALAGCESELGPPNIDAVAYQPLGSVTGDPPDDFKEGPDPYVDGEQRLSLGIFYEGGFSDTYEIDNQNTFFYIYSMTFAIEATTECAEGTFSDEIRHLGNGWLGGGVHFSETQDLSMWDSMQVSLKSESESMNNAKIHMKSAAEGILAASTYGFSADGEWHHLEIPLADFEDAGVDLAQIEVALMIILEGGTIDDTLLVDNVYFTAGASQ